MSSLLLLLALASPGINDLFDPFSKEFPGGAARFRAKQTAFKQLLDAKGAPKMLKAMAKAEASIAGAQKERDKVHKTFRRARDKYVDWMAKYRKAYMRKERREPAEYPVPKSLERACIDGEDAIKRANALVLTELRFAAWAMDRLAEQPLDDKLRAEAEKAAKSKSPHQAARGRRLLEGKKPPALESVPVPKPAEGVPAFFDVPVDSKKFVLVLPSGSQAMANELDRFLQTVPPTATFALVAFGYDGKLWKKKPAPNTGLNRQAAVKWLAAGPVGPGMDAFTALDLGLSYGSAVDTMLVVIPSSPTRRDDTGALVVSPMQIGFEIEHRNVGIGMRVLAIADSDGGEAFYLQRIARWFGGGVRKVGR